MDRKCSDMGMDLAGLFGAGAYSSAIGHGLSRQDAESVASRCWQSYKEAASRASYYDDEDDDDGSTWFSRNKGWVIPAIGIPAAFVLGADAQRNGDPKKGILGKLGDVWGRRLLHLLGQGHMLNPEWKKMLYGGGGKSDAQKPVSTSAATGSSGEIPDYVLEVE